MERKLASIQTILEVLPHTNADTLEIAKVLGWTCVVLKGQFKKGDHIVYIEPDSILPPGKSEWEFMKDRGYRIKTIKLRGVVSQGLVFNAHTLLAEKYLPLCEALNVSPLPDGTDVTEALGITKYEPYTPEQRAQLFGTVKGNFPEFLSKTDETRIQAIPEVLYKHQNKKFYVTEKVDGSSMTVYFRRSEHFVDGEFGVCSRNLDLKETESNAFWKTARELDLENKLRSLNRNVALQGELLGPGVQGNKYKLDKLGYYIFNAYDIDTGFHFNYTDLAQVVEYLGLTHVPFVSDSYILPNTVDELVEYSKGKSLLNKDVHREGIVLRPLINEYSEELRGRLSFKTINPDFLLKYNE
jgi:RNA ligase (TIGR02306 family)